MIQLSQKEKMFLEDDKQQEEVCVLKYKNYGKQAKDTELQQLCNKLSDEEQHHFNIIDSLLNGETPNLTQGHQQTGQSQNQGGTWKNSSMPTLGNEDDKILCSDLLASEKYVSGVYDTSIFESANSEVRQALQHIQKEEQSHGEQIFNYMNSHGMYQVK